ncbi:toxin secretion, membrane fusion protein, partial [Shewanella indica]
MTETEKVLERQQLLLDKKHKLQQQEFEGFNKIYSNGYLSETEHQSQQQKLLQIAQEMESNKSNIVNISA